MFPQEQTEEHNPWSQRTIFTQQGLPQAHSALSDALMLLNMCTILHNYSISDTDITLSDQGKEFIKMRLIRQIFLTMHSKLL